MKLWCRQQLIPQENSGSEDSHKHVLSCQNSRSKVRLSLQIQDVRLSFICSMHYLMEEKKTKYAPICY